MEPFKIASIYDLMLLSEYQPLKNWYIAIVMHLIDFYQNTIQYLSSDMLTQFLIMIYLS